MTIKPRRRASHLTHLRLASSVAGLWYAVDWRAGRHPGPREGRRPPRSRWSIQFV